MPEPTIQVLQKLVSYSALRQKTISKNIANISTENYQREEVRFNDLLSEQMNSNLKATESRHFDTANNSNPASEYIVVKDNSPELSSGVNNVNIEKEMADLAENSIMYKFAAKRLSSYFKTLQSVIKGSVS
ncbi:MAG: flagellar basal body rod protein FlgB [Ignavibacteriales bacterium]|nr:MAG: flagellar basal body rod protein FlgB [Ignavibacteriales bacterium]